MSGFGGEILGQSRVDLTTKGYSIGVIIVRVGVLWSYGWMDQDESWHGGRPRPRPHCVRWGTISPQKGAALPQFLAHVCCGQRLDGSICHLVWT